MPKKIKLSLKDLDVTSFTTSTEDLNGGEISGSRMITRWPSGKCNCASDAVCDTYCEDCLF